MQKAQTLFDEARFEEALAVCYSAEIEANMLIVKAQNQIEIEKKIAYYKEALVAISKFSDKELLLMEQNKLNQILAELYEPIDEETSRIYYLKVSSRLPPAPSKKKHEWFYVLALLLFLYLFFILFGGKSKTI